VLATTNAANVRANKTRSTTTSGRCLQPMAAAESRSFERRAFSNHRV